MTAAALDRVLHEVLGEPFVSFALLQGPGGAIVASAGTPPRWAPDGDPDRPGADPRDGVEASPDLVLDVGSCHVLHVEATREPNDGELERIRALFATAL